MGATSATFFTADAGAVIWATKRFAIDVVFPEPGPPVTTARRSSRSIVDKVVATYTSSAYDFAEYKEFRSSTKGAVTPERGKVTNCGYDDRISFHAFSSLGHPAMGAPSIDPRGVRAARSTHELPDSGFSNVNASTTHNNGDTCVDTPTLCINTLTPSTASRVTISASMKGFTDAGMLRD